jgi:hypothetical protein
VGAKKFDRLWDFVRFGMNIHLSCANGHCSHRGIVDAHSACMWFRLHRWPDAIGGSCLPHFRCTKCGAIAGSARPTDGKPTVVDFFPADERGWKQLATRLRR